MVSIKLSKHSFTRLTDPPPDGNIQFYDGYFPALDANTYNITLTHTITPPSGQPPIDPYQVAQTVVVEAPEFTIDTNIVQMQYPPNGGSDIYDSELPFLVITDPSLPWERSLYPGQKVSGNPLPWIALVIFAEGEIYLPANSNNPVRTCTVAQLIEPDPFGNILKPTLPVGWVAPAVMTTQCQTIVIPGEVFEAVMPQTTDLPFLAHLRAVNTANEDQTLLSVLLANRLPLANGAPQRFYAHLVSLEGFGAYLGPDAQPIPTVQGQQLMSVQMASLFNWTFVSLPEVGLNFEQLMTGLIESQTESATLALPIPIGSSIPQPALGRLQDGYSAVTFISGSGEETFAWYRGPFTPVAPQPLPRVGNPAIPVNEAKKADELMIYLAEQGVFDLSYSAAWNIGRALALADANFAQAINRLSQGAASALNNLTQRLSMNHFAPETNLSELLASDATRRRFKTLMGAGLGRDWTAALAAANAGQNAAYHRRPRSGKRGPKLHPRDVLARPDVPAAMLERLGALIDPIGAWLDNLTLLYPLPFSYLAPDPRMLPVESIRFFYVDSNWIEALVAGAMSIQVKTTRDLAILQALRPAIDEAMVRHRTRRLQQTRHSSSGDQESTTLTGVLIRSEMVSRWPALAVSASLQGTPLTIVRDDRPSPNVRLTLFQGVPDTINLAEPYQGLQFGIEDNGVAPRYVTSSGPAGGQIPNAPTVPPTGQNFVSVYCNPPAGQAVGGVINVASLASALTQATGATSAEFGAGDFAIQMVKAPEMQAFAAGEAQRTR